MADIKHLVEIEAPAETIYRAVTEQAGLAAWWTRQTIAKPEVGSIAEFRFGDRYHNKMRVVALEENRRVEWVCLKGVEEWEGTTFVFDIEETDGTTVLRFTHGKWSAMTDFFAVCNYHWGHYMKSLKSYCETGAGDPFEEKG